MILKRFELRHASPMADGYCFGGDSSSSSTSQQVTNNTDARVAIQNGATIGEGASVNGLIINDGAVQMHAMDVVGTSTQAALSANVQAMKDAQGAMQAASQAAAQAAAQASQMSASVANNAMAGTWLAANDLNAKMLEGMNTVLSSANNVMDMEQEAFKQVGGQISGAYQAASDISTGNRQLVTVGMIAAGMVALMAMRKMTA